MFIKKQHILAKIQIFFKQIKVLDILNQSIIFQKYLTAKLELFNLQNIGGFIFNELSFLHIRYFLY